MYTIICLCLFCLGSAAYKKLCEILTRPRLITEIRKLSNDHQTSTLEAKHALDNQFASKKTYYPYHSLMARYKTFSFFFITVIYCRNVVMFCLAKLLLISDDKC